MCVEFNEEFGVPAPLAERLFLEARFREVWKSGWRRLRRQAAGRGETSSPAGE